MTFQPSSLPLEDPETTPVDGLTRDPAQLSLLTLVAPPLDAAVAEALVAVPQSSLKRPTDLQPVRDRHLRERTYRRALASADALSALIVTLVAATIAGVGPKLIFLLVPFFTVLVAKVQGLYDRDDMVIRKSTLAEWRRLLQAALLTGAVTYTEWHLVTTAGQARGVRLFTGLVIGTFVLTFLARVLARRLALELSPPERCAVVGTPDQCQPFAAALAQIPGVEVAAVAGNSVFGGSLQQVREEIELRGIQRVIIGPYAPWREMHTLELVRNLKWLGVRVSLMPSIMGVVGGATVADDMDGTVVLGVPSFGMSRSSHLLKRAFDLLVGTFTCLLVAIPALLIAAWIKLDSRGPVIFRQVRIGRDGHPFTMYKFRSMVEDAEALKHHLNERNEATNGLFKMNDDPRVTRVGRVMRKTYLDELPQLINVLRGEMSLVGPRPLISSEDALLIGSDRHRLTLVPGMTGPWQLRGPLEASLPELAKLDYLYASNWSVWRDLDIILGTALRIFRRHGR